MEEAIKNGETAMATVNVHDDWKMEAGEETYEPGVKDFNGNV